MNCAPYPICASISSSVQRQKFAFMLFFKVPFTQTLWLLEMVFGGVTHTVGKEEQTAATSDLDGDYSAFSYIGHQVVIHTLRWGF